MNALTPSWKILCVCMSVMWYFKGWLYDAVISIRQKLQASVKCQEMLKDLKLYMETFDRAVLWVYYFRKIGEDTMKWDGPHYFFHILNYIPFCYVMLRRGKGYVWSLNY